MTHMPPLALLAGGLATRLRPHTLQVPKAMIEVAGEPFIAHQLRLMRRERVSRVVLCVGYLGEQIEAFVKDGKQFGVAVDYCYDGPTLLGTGGALRRALPHLGSEFLVMYGDSWLDNAFAPIVSVFRDSGKPALMTVFRNEGQWDVSNVQYKNGIIHRYDKIERRPADEAYRLGTEYREGRSSGATAFRHQIRSRGDLFGPCAPRPACRIRGHNALLRSRLNRGAA